MVDLSPLVEAGTRKSGLVWIAVPGQQVRAAWHLWSEGAALVLHGPDEQEMPGLAEADRVAVTVRSTDKGSRLVTWEAAVDSVPPGSTSWDELMPALQRARLNSPDGPAAPDRWARTCTLTRLTPTGVLLEEPGSYPAGSLAAAPLPSPAKTPVRIPFTVGRRPRPR
ncbi:MAG: hypothetical protein ACYDAQ_18010 [Mycobacteriales bacterium]